MKVSTTSIPNVEARRFEKLVAERCMIGRIIDRHRPFWKVWRDTTAVAVMPQRSMKAPR
jgi:hypothetical protein